MFTTSPDALASKSGLNFYARKFTRMSHIVQMLNSQIVTMQILHCVLTVPCQYSGYEASAQCERKEMRSCNGGERNDWIQFT